MKILRYLAITAAFFMAIDSFAQVSKPKMVVHAVNNLSHYYDFHADWGFPRQYLNNGTNKYIKSWCCIYNTDLSNANLLFLFNCDDRLPYVEKDLLKIKNFLKDGGGLMVLSSGNSAEQNKLAHLYGAEFIKGLKVPVKAKIETNAKVDLKKNGNCHLKFTNPKKWNVVVEDSLGNAVLAYTKAGKGIVLLGSRALLADNPDNRNDTINRALWHQVWDKVASGKKIDTAKTFKTEYIEKIENNINKDGLDISFNDYLAPCANAMFEIAKRCMPNIEKIMGVPLSKGMASKIILIPTGGGGYSSGAVLALAVWWGGFPEKEDSMIEFITHESVHSWVLPFGEVWNEPIATYVGNLVMLDMGHAEEGLKRINDQIKRALKFDPEMKLYDLKGNSMSGAPKLTGADQNNVHWGKTYWILEEMRKSDPDVIAKYFQAKRKYATSDKITRYDMNNTVAVMSIAMKRDLFNWFREHGFDVDRSKAEIKFEL